MCVCVCVCMCVCEGEEGLGENCTQMFIAIMCKLFLFFGFSAIFLRWIYNTCVITKKKSSHSSGTPNLKSLRGFSRPYLHPSFS